MGKITYSNEDPSAPAGTTVADLLPDTEFQKRLLAVYGHPKFANAAAKLIANRIDRAMQKGKMPKEYIDGIIGWVEKKIANRGYIPMITMLSMMTNKARLEAWKARQDASKGMAPESKRPEEYGI